MVWSPVNGKSPGITSGFRVKIQRSVSDINISCNSLSCPMKSEIRIYIDEVCRTSWTGLVCTNGKKVGVTWIWVNILQNWGSNGSRKWVLVFHKPSISSKPSIWVCLKIGDPQFQLSSCSLLQNIIIPWFSMAITGGTSIPDFPKAVLGISQFEARYLTRLPRSAACTRICRAGCCWQWGRRAVLVLSLKLSWNSHNIPQLRCL